MLGYFPPIRLPSDVRPQLIVVIDAEEEFDWNTSPDRNATIVSGMRKITRVQRIFDEYGIKPCYAIDYPVASQPEGFEILRDIYQDGRCEVAAHLHPWVNPPYSEELSLFNTYAGNLSRELEFEKLKSLRDKIEENFGIQPAIYKAGRYGIGSNTSEILSELGFTIDLSVCASVDYSADGGPDYSDAHAEPYWFGPDNAKMLEIPLTGAFVGWAGALSSMLYDAAGKLDFLKARAILARLSAVDRLMLSPEGFTTREHIKITKFLYNRGVRTFTWSFHSPRVASEQSHYLPTESELQEFLDSFNHFFDFFFGELNGVASTPTNIFNQLVTLK